jgi:hypothetical protein
MAFPTSPTNGQIYKNLSWNSAKTAWVKDEHTEWGRILAENTPRYMGIGAASTAANFQGILRPDVTLMNIGNHFNTSTGEFTCPLTGIYFMMFDALIQTNSSRYAYASAQFFRNSGNAAGHAHNMHDHVRSYEMLNLNSSVQASAGDRLTCRIQCYEGASIYAGLYTRLGIVYLG